MHVHAVEMSVEPYCNNTEYAESIALVLLPTIEDVSPPRQFNNDMLFEQTQINAKNMLFIGQVI